MAKFNYALIMKEVAASRGVQEEVHDIVEGVFEKAKQKMLVDLDRHVITKELREGPEGANISNTLPEGYGNLFSFIGFNAEDDPVIAVEETLEKIQFPYRSYASPFIKGKFRTINLTYRINLPSIEDFPNTQYPDKWRDGSWVEGIESGIPGFESYLFDENFDAYVQSRSTTALQAKDKSGAIVIIREGAYTPTKYVSEILDNFVKNLR